MNRLLVIAYPCSEGIKPKRVVALNPDVDKHCQLATDAKQPVLGLSSWGSTKGLQCDVTLIGTDKVEFAGDIKTGDPIVVNGEGMVVKFDPANFVAGDQVWVLGKSSEDGDAGTVGIVFIQPFMILI